MTPPNDLSPLPANEGEATRQRQYRITARLLKEYTARLYQIAKLLGEYLDGRSPNRKGTPPNVSVYQAVLWGHRPATSEGSGKQAPWSVYRAVWRYRAIWEEVHALALFASQMLVHYDLDEAEAAELRLRVADAERSIFEAGITVNLLAMEDPANYGLPIPGPRLEMVLNQSRGGTNG